MKPCHILGMDWNGLNPYRNAFNPLDWAVLKEMLQAYWISWVHLNGLNPLNGFHLYWLKILYSPPNWSRQKDWIAQICTQLYVIRKHDKYIRIRFLIDYFLVILSNNPWYGCGYLTPSNVFSELGLEHHQSSWQMPVRI